MQRPATGARDLPELSDAGEAPELRGITEWINSEPLTLKALRGQGIQIIRSAKDPVSTDNTRTVWVSAPR